ncbi:hypothetical protein CPC16_008760 [Podila verticillata]|nr:hypothetical protein BGZ52_002219 [Haplosporangium bisporale]KAF9383794.1 hypothetical protein CPC16_008760 [Podila verticillata]
MMLKTFSFMAILALFFVLQVSATNSRRDEVHKATSPAGEAVIVSTEDDDDTSKWGWGWGGGYGGYGGWYRPWWGRYYGGYGGHWW